MIKLQVIEAMDYRFENGSRENITVDTTIVERTLNNPETTPEQVKDLALWGSLSKKEKQIEEVINNYIQKIEQNSINVTR